MTICWKKLSPKRVAAIAVRVNAAERVVCLIKPCIYP
jgi:hypothetical protein